VIPVPEESVDLEIASRDPVVPSGRFCVRRNVRCPGARAASLGGLVA
jgi:hypothetical protein